MHFEQGGFDAAHLQLQHSRLQCRVVCGHAGAALVGQADLVLLRRKLTHVSVHLAANGRQPVQLGQLHRNISFSS
jgi:hypothetical protein